MAQDEDAVICGLARVYGLYDMRTVRPSVAGTLFAGLSKPTTDQILLAQCCDKLANLVWMFSKDGQDRINEPVSLVSVLMGEPEEESDMIGYDSPEDFWKEMERYG